MALIWEVGAVLNIASGVLIAALGAALLVTDPRRVRNRVFGAFALFWGAQIVTINVVRVTPDAETARFAGEMSLAFLVPLYFFMLSFASIFPRPRPPFGTSSLAVALLALPAAVTLAILFAAPDLLIEGVERTATGAFTVHWGPLMPFLVTAPFYGALFYALFVFMRRLDETGSPIERRQISFVLAALALFLAYATPIQLALFGGEALGLG
ncbi:MAG: histidine kinase N-terminal 7TM domain-containing protein, partial [Myxococcota bacterium]